MSQIHYDYISLEEMVLRSSVILVARKVEPFTTAEDIPLRKSKGSKGEDLPPYRKMYWHFYVEEILKNQRGEVKKGPIIVTEAHFDASFKVHESYFVDGLARSPMYLAYNTSLNIGAVDRAILFLQLSETGLRYAFDFAWESMENLKEIKKLIRKNKKGRYFGRGS